jgi:hypothetical protein
MHQPDDQEAAGKVVHSAAHCAKDAAHGQEAWVPERLLLPLPGYEQVARYKHKRGDSRPAERRTALKRSQGVCEQIFGYFG